MEGTDWEKVLQGAYRWPHLRIDGWKQYEKAEPSGARKMRHEILKPISELGKCYTLSDDLVFVITKLARSIDPVLLFDATKSVRMPFNFTIFGVPGAALRQAYASSRVNVSDLTQGDMAFIVLTGTDEGKSIILANHDDCINPLAFYPVTLATGPLVNGAVAADLVETTLRKLKGLNSHLADDGLRHATHWLLGEFRISKFPEAARAIDQDRDLVPYVANLTNFTRRFVHYQNAAGSMCWFAALCYLMAQPTIVRYVDRIGAERAPSGRLRASSPETATALTIFLPREKVITRMLRHASRPRKEVGEHDVMGFWSFSHRRGDPDCKHAWPLEFSRRQVCSLCNALRWWKEPHRRGHGPVRAVSARRLDYSGQDVNALIARAGNVQAGT